MIKQQVDVVVVGAGPAGLSAARAAAQAGARVAVLDDNPRAGGQVWRNGPAHPPAAALTWQLAALRSAGNVVLLSSARVVAPLDDRGLLVESAQRGALELGYQRLILATGARERLLPFDGWTLPGVTGAGGLQALIKGGMPVRGERIVIAGSGPLLIASLATARQAGATVLAVVEQAPWSALARFGIGLAATPSKLWQAAQLTRGFGGLRYLTGSVVREAHGDGRVERISIRRGASADRAADVVFDCDRIACGYGLVPNITLGDALGCAIRRDAAAGSVLIVDHEQRTSLDQVFAAGECTGIGGMELASVEGEIAGLNAVGATREATRLHAQRDRWQRFARRVETAFALREAARALPSDHTVLCRCEDVSCADVREHTNWRDAKLQTRCGMGPCQGRVCATAAEVYFGWNTAQTRPPFSPARIATLLEAAPEPATASE
ncbi:NAD(P)/FAD-dependent oxidoreductase [Paraburkholderia rhizosphaerae]|uniref:NADPH-dependent 2,4-dienoyl-CoA reductase/sulfur reductase-like enzyme n=1 Tax=Paraburkholderia rhizosphaerae TaxID=480658 RepID=A0A4R8M2Y9_9BURK|nr:FAD/NAD(P)-binding oxidoreductase [Paraburkholderia rhizosphaerae]TDY54083.1 NADPH-dependent 2,4-dienoyl-CoA reductase/sulfur reductase-like enzyme [Paraburkholderia rhizosphaerae]